MRMTNRRNHRRLFSVPLCLCVSLCIGIAAGQDANLVQKSWTVDGVEREALLAAPASTKQSPAPLVFVWHGHGGTMRNSARSFHIHTLWPEAVVVYPQGLNTP